MSLVLAQILPKGVVQSTKIYLQGDFPCKRQRNCIFVLLNLCFTEAYNGYRSGKI